MLAMVAASLWPHSSTSMQTRRSRSARRSPMVSASLLKNYRRSLSDATGGTALS